MPSKITSRVVWTSKAEQKRAIQRAKRTSSRNFSDYIRTLVEQDLEDESTVKANTARP